MSAATCCWPAAPAARRPASPAWSRSPPSTAAPMPRWPSATAIPASSSSFLARHHPLAIIPVAILLGGIGASGGLLQRRLDLPDAAVVVLQGILFVAILASETLYGRAAGSRRRPPDGRRRPRPVGRAARHAGGRHPRQHAVHLRQRRRMPDRALGPHQSRPRRHAGDGRDERLRRRAGDRLAVARRARRGLRRPAAGRAACRDLPAAAGQRRRHRHRPDAVRHRPRLLPRQALHPAQGAQPRRHRSRLVEQHPAGPPGAAGELPLRRSASCSAFAHGLGAARTRAGA